MTNWGSFDQFFLINYATESLIVFMVKTKENWPNVKMLENRHLTVVVVILSLVRLYNLNQNELNAFILEIATTLVVFQTEEN